MIKKRIVWAPQEGAQQRFMTCPTWECLLQGNRGGGKTDTLLMDYAQGVGRGWGADYRGLLLREATTELGDVIAKAKKWYPKMFPGAKWNGQKKTWTFPDGETLWLNYARVEADYDQYHGHEYPWIGWEELTNHAVDTIYLKLMSCNRSSNMLIPKKYRATCNPAGPGHAWVKRRFIDVCQSGRVFRELMEIPVFDELTGDLIPQKMEVTRTHIFSDIRENKMLLKADPLYIAKIMQMTKDDEMLRKAWIDGSWDLVIGGFFTDVWRHETHVLPWFPIPRTWHCFRSFDWGSSKPWCVSYIAESNGEQPDYPGLPYMPKGTCVVINEIYGWNGFPNQGDMATSSVISDRVRQMDDAVLKEYGLKVHPGPADTSIYDVKDGTSIGIEMSKYRCNWVRAHKGPGSRITGWSMIRQMLGAALRGDKEAAHLYFLQQARHHIRVLPIMQRDEKKPEDIDTDLEDHPMDSLRYGLARKLMSLKIGKVGI